MGDLGNIEDELCAVTREIHRHEIKLGPLKAKRDGLIARHAEEISRRRMAELTDLTPGRIQQIIDRVRR